MEGRIDMDKVDEVLLPGFRFHPTDEELVSFYLKRKVQQKPLAIELISQLDIYRFDPWDLPSKKLFSRKLDILDTFINGNVLIFQLGIYFIIHGHFSFFFFPFLFLGD